MFGCVLYEMITLEKLFTHVFVRKDEIANNAFVERVKKNVKNALFKETLKK